MKKYLPLFLLIVFICSEAFTKGYLEYSPKFAHIYHQIISSSTLILFLSGVLLFFYLNRSSNGKHLWDAFTTPSSYTRWHSWAIIAILLLGFGLRLVKIGTLVDGMTFDEAYKGLDGIAIREFGERPIFLDWNVGREALVAYLVAVSQSLFDYSIISVRIITALTACLALVFFYLFTKTIFNSHLALLSTFLLAVSKYHIIHSRYGVRAGQFMVFELAVLYLLARGFASERRNSKAFLIAGAITGTGFYTYIAYRIFPLVALAFAFQKNIRPKIRHHLLSILGGSVICLLITAPLAIYYAKNSESFTERMKRTAVWEQKGKSKEISPAKLIYESTLNTLGMFTYKGDSIARHNVQMEPMLSPFTTAFFLLGILLTLINIRKRYALFLLFYFVIGILPGVLSVHAPNTPRTLASLPPVMLFTAFGVFGAYYLINQYRRHAGIVFLSVILGGSFFTGINDALIRYPAQLDDLSPKFSALWGMDRDQKAVAELMNSLGSNVDIYLTPQFFFHSTLEYLTYSKTPHRLYTLNTDILKGNTDRTLAIVILQLNRINPWWLRDDDGKKFFKWWNQYYGMNVQKIRAINENSYDRYLTNVSDRKLYRVLKTRYPRGREIQLGNFSAYLVPMR